MGICLHVRAVYIVLCAVLFRQFELVGRVVIIIFAIQLDKHRAANTIAGVSELAFQRMYRI